MRVYGRDTNTGRWIEVSTDALGHNDYVYITALIQNLKLNLNESPFWANWGIPAQQSVVQQIFPDFYVALIQQRFSAYFAALVIQKIQSTTPTYSIKIVTNQGVKFQMSIAA
jgi:hypothetical protein